MHWRNRTPGTDCARVLSFGPGTRDHGTLHVGARWRRGAVAKRVDYAGAHHVARLVRFHERRGCCRHRRRNADNAGLRHRDAPPRGARTTHPRACLNPPTSTRALTPPHHHHHHTHTHTHTHPHLPSQSHGRHGCRPLRQQWDHASVRPSREQARNRLAHTRWRGEGRLERERDVLDLPAHRPTVTPANLP